MLTGFNSWLLIHSKYRVSDGVIYVVKSSLFPHYFTIVKNMQKAKEPSP